MRYNNVKTLIESTVKENGENGITGNGLQNVLLTMLDYISTLHNEEDVMYGVEWDVTVADSAMTRIGNMALHRQLPIQNRMKGCLLDDNGKVVEYLPPTSWLGATRDGSRGQVEVEVPDHYRKFETDGNIRRTKISEYPLPGYHYVPKMYISAYEATVQRSTNMLCSVVNSDPDYRGGDNTADWDGTYRSLLGRPATNLNSPTLRTCARNRKQGSTEWNMLTYDAYKALFWLYYIEYANRNCQKPFNAEKDSNGFSQGGLGDGATTMAYNESESLNSFNPIVPCGYTDSLGNSSGTIPFDVEFADGSIRSISVARYRGIENPFGHIAKWIDGLRVRINGDQKASVYIAEDPALFNDEDFSEYRHAGIEPLSGEGHVKDILFGEYGDICCAEVGGSNTTYWCDRHQAGPSGADSRTMVTRWGGTLQGGWQCGLAFEYTYFQPLNSEKDTGTRLCFIPQNNK